MPKIEHVVVLMLENRSFDAMLGQLYPKSDRFDGLDMTEDNPWHKPDASVEKIWVWSAEGDLGPGCPTQSQASPSTTSRCNSLAWGRVRRESRP
jgi:phospholipase C